MAVDGSAGIELLASLYVSNPGRGRDELEAVVKALSVQAKAAPELRGPVADAYRLVLERQPAMAPAMVHDLIAWKRWDFAPRIREIRQGSPADPLAAYALGLYLRLAAANEILVPSSNDRDDDTRSVSGQQAQE